MSLDTYANLQTSIADWLERGDLTSLIPDFIRLGEDRVNRDLRVKDMEARSTTTMTAGTQYYALPTDYLEARNIQLNTNPVTQLRYRTPEQLDTEFPYQSTTGKPIRFTVIANQLQVIPSPDSDYEMEIVYFQKIPSLSDTNTTNYLTESQPALILYSSLLAAEAYLVNDIRVQTWATLYKEALDGLNKSEQRGRYSGSTLEIRSATSNP